MTEAGDGRAQENAGCEAHGHPLAAPKRGNGGGAREAFLCQGASGQGREAKEEGSDGDIDSEPFPEPDGDHEASGGVLAGFKSLGDLDFLRTGTMQLRIRDRQSEQQDCAKDEIGMT